MARVRSPILVGRDHELTALQGALDDAVAGRAPMVVVAGEAGIGKTRLVDEFLRGPAASAGARGCVGACLDLGAGAVPYAPFVEIVRRARLASEARDEVPVPDPFDHVLAAGERDAASAPSDVTDDLRRARFYGAMLDVLGGLATTAPLVVVVEDVHWADRASLELATFVIRNLRDLPVLFIVTTRNDELGRDTGRDEMLAAVLRDHRTLRLVAPGSR